MGSGFWSTSIKNTGNAVAVQECDSGGRRMRQSCGRAVFSARLHKKKVKVQYKVTTSVVEPQMMTVAPLYQDRDFPCTLQMSVLLTYNYKYLHFSKADKNDLDHVLIRFK